jgi:L-serine dehydratase
MNSFAEISAYCRENEIRLWQYVEECEGEEIWDYLKECWSVMQEAIKRGVNAQGILPGGLGTQRKARYLFRQKHIDQSEETKTNRLICAYAFAVSEENAGGGKIVTAPTCGACGVVPAVLKFLQVKRNFTEEEILHGLATAGLIGNLIKTNASISGAECGCQAEIGTACAMAAAAAAELYDLDIDQIEYAAEMEIEHHLGLTCDPICGLVQIPCIERNAIAAMRALNAVNLADFLADSRKISFDMIVDTMYETGKDLKVIYRETSEGGMAKKFKR